VIVQNKSYPVSLDRISEFPSPHSTNVLFNWLVQGVLVESDTRNKRTIVVSFTLPMSYYGTWQISFLFFIECYEPTSWQSQVAAAVWQWEKMGTDLWSGKKQWSF
jgi:hypothetical protein